LYSIGRGQEIETGDYGGATKEDAGRKKKEVNYEV